MRPSLLLAALLLCGGVLISPSSRPSHAEGAASEEPVFTGSAEAGTGSAAFRLGFYRNGDGPDKGNPFLDETLTVVEPIFLVDYNISDRLAAWGQLAYDYVSSASIARLSKYPDQSGASGDQYIGIDLGARYELDENDRVGGYVSGSVEYDYTSFGLGADYSRDLANKNATLGLQLNGYIDSLDVIRFDGTKHGTAQRYSFTTTLGWHQVLTRRLYSDVGATFSYQDGFLGTPYNAVVVENPSLPPNSNLDNSARGYEITEELPGQRFRGALYGRARQLILPGTSFELGGRLYGDSWGIRSVSVEPNLYQMLWSDVLNARIGYRFYTQSEADAFARSFTAEPTGYRTQDSDLAAFDSHAVNLRLGWIWSPTLNFDLTGGYVFRSDGIDQLTLSFGMRKDFDGHALWESRWWK